ncbi:DUF434 domain-containing protein [Dissulfurirhabdus thermomarina]|uniref:DUF434 domain-containing protein n=1 Tax=Dissulfurirhabdus thermomarina TaxID=1765737 RepID=A0A6N9TLT5_DISTH|nr:DUF434 domain-containing protein [Dissulfurirhabdus thermomarina]NDY41998.1 DUF434 domain-containing protein [Dissulfurirhabdus thermomarina]NMX24017.1 DUF434 domain-containing protein [Dissulfurirhabdus thermomarina]
MRDRPFREDRWRPAARDLRWLLDRGYPRQPALAFVGNHFQLHQGERDLLYRGIFRRDQARARRARRVRLRDLAGRGLAIDGHNVLITLESALRGRPLLVADDGFVRDVSRVFRRFRPTDRTRAAWGLVGACLRDHPPAEVLVVLDAPLPRSGELAGRIRRWMREAGIPGEVRAVRRPEGVLAAFDGVAATADSVVLDRHPALLDLAGHIIRRRLRVRPWRMPR